MVVKTIKSIVSLFLFLVAVLLSFIWLVLGTLFLFVTLIRFIALYTIALINSFISGNPVTHNYMTAIEEIINMYVNTYAKIFSMPTLPWSDDQNDKGEQLRALLPSEINELKKSWAVTLAVFISYLGFLGSTTAMLIYRDNYNLKKEYEPKIQSLNNQIQNANEIKEKYESTIDKYKLSSKKEVKRKIKTISKLYKERGYSIRSISEIMGINYAETKKFITDNNITRY